MKILRNTLVITFAILVLMSSFVFIMAGVLSIRKSVDMTNVIFLLINFALGITAVLLIISLFLNKEKGLELAKNTLILTQVLAFANYVLTNIDYMIKNKLSIGGFFREVGTFAILQSLFIQLIRIIITYIIYLIYKKVFEDEKNIEMTSK